MNGMIGILFLGVLCVIPLVVLAGFIAVIVILNKRLSPSSWYRKILAVATGVIVDLGGTNVVAGIYTLLVVFGMALKLAQQQLPSAEIRERLMSQITEVAIAEALPVMALGILLSLLGGWVAGRIARRNEVVYGFATGLGVALTSLTLTVLMGRSLEITDPLWKIALSLAVNIGSTTLGGLLAYWQRRRKEAQTAADGPATG